MRLPFRQNSSEPARGSSESELSEVVPPPFELGRRGEQLAVEYLTQHGYRIVAANFSVPVGRNRRDAVVKAEIDIVAYDGPILCFIEVKTRASDEVALPQANVDSRKQRQIARAARGYRAMLGLMNAPYRYDVVTVVSGPSAKPDQHPSRIRLLKNYWTDTKLHRRRSYETHWD